MLRRGKVRMGGRWFTEWCDPRRGHDVATWYLVGVLGEQVACAVILAGCQPADKQYEQESFVTRAAKTGMSHGVAVRGDES